MFHYGKTEPEDERKKEDNLYCCNAHHIEIKKMLYGHTYCIFTVIKSPMRVNRSMNRKIYRLLLCALLISSALGCSEGHADRKLQNNAAPRFTNPDGTIPISSIEDVVLDNLTGLMWRKDDNCIKTNYPAVSARDGLVAYKDALDFISGLNKGEYPKCSSGYNDWRLPSKKELRGLLNIADSPINVWMSRRAVANIQIGRYWFSFDEDRGTIGGRLFFDWYYGHVYPYLKSNGCYVWPVRSEDKRLIDGAEVDQKEKKTRKQS
ncbi:MAG: DUF1566 domain-containing protein [Planctomycetota bacterium]